MITLRSQLLPLTFEAHQMRQCLGRGGFGNGYVGLGSPMSQVNHSHFRDSGDRQKTPVASFFEQVELQKILSLLELDDVNVKIHAAKVLANLAAVESNKARIVEVDGLDSLLMLLSSSNDETICRVAAGAIANLAMNEANQKLIMVQGGIILLSKLLMLMIRELYTRLLVPLEICDYGRLHYLI